MQSNVNLIKENKKLFNELKVIHQKMKEDLLVENSGEENRNLKLLQALQRQLLQIYTRTGPINQVK